MSPWIIAVFVIGLVGAPFSLFLNTCIILETRKSLSNVVRTSQVDLLQLIMGITNIFLCCLFNASNIIILFPNLYHSEMYLLVLLPILILLRFSYWLMAWLCAYYCTSITRFNLRVFVGIKKILSNFLPHLIILTGFVSLALVFVHFKRVMSELSDPMEGTFNSTEMSELDIYYTFARILEICLDFGLPFTIMVTSVMVTVSSLLIHICNINKADAGLRQNIQAHVNAARTMMLLLLLSFTFNISAIVTITVAYSFENPLTMIGWTLVTTFPAAEGAILIQASPKLRNMFLTHLSAIRLAGLRN